jgi:lipoyl(octanoyl) transferase
LADGENILTLRRPFAGRMLEAYLLPVQTWDDTFALEQRLAFEISGEPERRAAVVLAEHGPLITVGRHGSRRHLRVEEEDLRRRGFELRFVARGGGVQVHVPGQLHVGLVLPLSAGEFGLADVRAALYRALLATAREFAPLTTHEPGQPGILLGDRVIGAVGLAARRDTTFHGGWLNVNPLPRTFEWTWPLPDRPMLASSLFRELRTPVPMPAVREAMLRNLAADLGFEVTAVCDPPAVTPRPPRRVSA